MLLSLKIFLIDKGSLNKQGVCSLRKSVKLGVEPNRNQNVLILMHTKLYKYKNTTLRTKHVSKEVIKGTVV